MKIVKVEISGNQYHHEYTGELVGHSQTVEYFGGVPCAVPCIIVAVNRRDGSGESNLVVQPLKRELYTVEVSERVHEPAWRRLSAPEARSPEGKPSGDAR